MASNAASVAAFSAAGHRSSTSNNSRINSSLLLLAATAVMVGGRGSPRLSGGGAPGGSDARGLGDEAALSSCNSQQQAAMSKAAAAAENPWPRSFSSSDASDETEPSGGARRPGRVPGPPRGPQSKTGGAGDAGRTPRRRAIETRRFCADALLAPEAAHAPLPIAGAALSSPKAAQHASARRRIGSSSSMATRTCTRTPRRTRCPGRRWRRARARRADRLWALRDRTARTCLRRHKACRNAWIPSSRVRTLNAQLPRGAVARVSGDSGIEWHAAGAGAAARPVYGRDDAARAAGAVRRARAAARFF